MNKDNQEEQASGECMDVKAQLNFTAHQSSFNLVAHAMTKVSSFRNFDLELFNHSSTHRCPACALSPTYESYEFIY